MIVDSSAIVSILVAEPGHEDLLDTLSDAEAPKVGTPTLVESGVVLTSRMGPAGKTLLGRFVQVLDMAVVPFTAEHAWVAIDAFMEYGKGRHPAGLNFGDCMTYATSKLAGEPLLCIGDDFSRTDLQLAR